MKSSNPDSDCVVVANVPGHTIDPTQSVCARACEAAAVDYFVVLVLFQQIVSHTLPVSSTGRPATTLPTSVLVFDMPKRWVSRTIGAADYYYYCIYPNAPQLLLSA